MEYTEHPAAPVGSWGPDVLGDGFQARLLPLLDDEFGPARAALVRYRGSGPPPTFTALWIHGWNDYFHQVELARQVTALGGAFYALDLRRYGRALQEEDLHGYVEHLSIYDEDIHAALEVIRAERGISGDLVLMAHSTGGLTAALWAHRHPGALRALVLDSPWLDLQGSVLLRTFGTSLADLLARLSPTTAIPLPEVSNYARTLAGWTEEDGERPEGTAGDPLYDGWQTNPRWRLVPSFPTRPGWLSAIRAGHAQVAEGLAITCPILVLCSQRSTSASKWTEEMRSSDCVLDVTQISQRSVQLGDQVTLVRLDGAIHDVFLSAAPVRAAAYRELSRWLKCYALPVA